MEFVETLPTIDRHSSRASKWDRVREELKSRPGEWARIKEVDSSTKAGALSQSFKRDGYETASRRLDTGEYAVFARFNPADSYSPDTVA